MLFSSYPVIFKGKLNKDNYLAFILTFLVGMVIGSFLIASTSFQSMTIGIYSLFLVCVIAVLNTIGMFLVLYAITFGKAGTIVPLSGGAQFIMIAVISAVLFTGVISYKVIIYPPILFLGVVLLTLKQDAHKQKLRFSKYIFLAIAGTISWIGMWLVFYQLPQSESAMFYYFLVTIVSLLIGILIVYIKSRPVRIKKYELRELRGPLLAGGFNGAGTAAFAYAYTANPVTSSIIVIAEIPIVVILSFLFLRERFNKLEFSGIVLILTALLLFVLI